MKYKLFADRIEIEGKEDFNPEHILECGQIFSYQKTEEWYVVFSKDKMAKVLEREKGFVIETKTPEYFENFFDLKTDYGQIKKRLSVYEILQKPIEFGHGIRILKQDLFETVISFIVSANNNIKRIQMILNRLREQLGTDMGGYHAFPTREQLLCVDEEFFTKVGAGYRAKYLYKVLRQINEDVLQDWQVLSSEALRNKLIELAGVGPKVADCILLFGFGRGDVFPVDTWIEKMYIKYYGKKVKDIEKLNRVKISQNLTSEFGLFSGYAQQYLFYFMRSAENE